MTEFGDDDVNVEASQPAEGPHADPGPQSDGAHDRGPTDVHATDVVLVAPQPNQTFFHVGPAGNTYTSDDGGHIIPSTIEDAAALRSLGCVDGEPKAKRHKR